MITEDDAIRIFHERYHSARLVIYEVGKTERDPLYPFTPNSWFVRFTQGDASLIQPTHVVCIASNGSIVYDGPACDEG